MTKMHTKLKCLIIDDEPIAHTVLGELIDGLPWLIFEAGCFNAYEALELVAEKSFDIIFLDVQMPGFSGLDLLEQLKMPGTSIILTTGFRDYAYEGFEHQVTDYLLKPISTARFLQAVMKVRQKLGHALTPSALYQKRLNEQSPTVTDFLQSVEDNSHIWLRSAGKEIRVNYRDIYLVKALKNYVTVFYTKGSVRIYGTLGTISKQFPDPQFVRINRSYLINRDAVSEIYGNTVKMSNGIEVTIPIKKSSLFLKP